MDTAEKKKKKNHKMSLTRCDQGCLSKSGAQFVLAAAAAVAVAVAATATDDNDDTLTGAINRGVNLMGAATILLPLLLPLPLPLGCDCGCDNGCDIIQCYTVFSRLTVRGNVGTT